MYHVLPVMEKGYLDQVKSQGENHEKVQGNDPVNLLPDNFSSPLNRVLVKVALFF